MNDASRPPITDAPAYRANEVADMLALPVGTVKAWCFGHDYHHKTDGSRKLFVRVIEPASPDDKLLSFANLCEVHVLAAIRRLHGVKLPAVRSAIDFVRTRMDVDRPLASSRFLTNGIALFVEHAGQLLNVSQQGQQTLREDFERALTRIEFDRRSGAPVLLFPFTRESPLEKDQPRTVVVDPARSFGRPVLAGVYVRTEVIENRFRAGDLIGDMARDYGVSPTAIEEALRFERRRAA